MANLSIKFNDLDLSEIFDSWEEVSPNRINPMTVSRRHGALIAEAVVVDARRFRMTGRLLGEGATLALRQASLRDKLDEMYELFAAPNKRLTLWDDRFINAYKANLGHAYILGSSLTAADMQVDFFCADPFWYSTVVQSEVQNLTTGDTAIDITNFIYEKTFNITNNGGVVVYPIITIVGSTRNITTIKVTSNTIGRFFTYSGTLITNKNLIVDTSYFTVTNDTTEDLTNWAGDFIWLMPGSNSITVRSTAPAQYTFTFTERWY